MWQFCRIEKQISRRTPITCWLLRIYCKQSDIAVFKTFVSLLLYISLQLTIAQYNVLTEHFLIKHLIDVANKLQPIIIYILLYINIKRCWWYFRPFIRLLVVGDLWSRMFCRSRRNPDLKLFNYLHYNNKNVLNKPIVCRIVAVRVIKQMLWT